jgi:cytochrome c-type biogenesis protein CcmH/NrfG
MPAKQLAELSHEAAVRALDLQERGVEQLRARTGTLLAASSLTASFLGAQAIRRGHSIGTLAALALVALASSIVLCIYVLLPKSDFVALILQLAFWSWALAASIS